VDAEYWHAALFYKGDDGFVSSTLLFIRDGLEAGEPTLVMVPGRKTALLREALGDDSAEVHFADMTEVGVNPARIIPAWCDFVREKAMPGRRLRGIGEPIWAGRTPAELVECQRHEALLNLAFGRDAPLDLVCPYDEQALDAAVIDEALRSHPVVLEDGELRESSSYAGLEHIAGPFSEPLPYPPATAVELGFEVSTLDAVRSFASLRAAEADLGATRSENLVIAVNELANNSVRHGGGSGVLRMWQEDDALVAEVSDRGQINTPLAGRELPDADEAGGHGLWLVNHLCDLMQIRTLPTGSVVRVLLRS
jgi:anti-sigma regulatory factor (Ser/Thr protein kinase)